MADENLGLDVLRGDLQAARAKLQTDIEHKIAVRDQIDALIASLSDGAADEASAAQAVTSAALRSRPEARAASPKRRRARRPRGLITNKVREFLQRQSEPVHATRILQYLEAEGAAPQSDKPMPTLQSTLQRMKETGEVRNTGRNRWVLTSKADAQAAPAPEPAVSEAPSQPSPAPEPSPSPVVSRSDSEGTAGGPREVSSTTSFRSFGGRSPADA